MADPYGRAVRDEYDDERDEPLLERYGDEVADHSQLDSLYFDDFAVETDDDEWLASRVDGPLLDVGAGTGRHARFFQERFETVAIEVSEHLVAVMRERGVADARRVDMFELREAFDRDRFRSALAIGTQLGLVASLRGLEALLGDLAYVTTPDATAVIDSYHPQRSVEHGVPGFRPDPTRGAAYRILQFEYEGEVGEPLLFRFFDPERLRDAVVGTGWDVSEIRRHPSDRENAVQYRAVLTKA